MSIYIVTGFNTKLKKRTNLSVFNSREKANNYIKQVYLMDNDWENLVAELWSVN